MAGSIPSLLAASAVVALAFSGTAASAQGLANGSLYVKGFGGASWPQGETIDFSGSLVKAVRAAGGSVSGDFDYDTGYLLGGAIGYAITPNIATELEYSYRNADVTFTARVSNGVNEQTLSEGGNVTSNAVMINALYRFDPMGATGTLQPYVGAGLGGVRVDFDGDSTDAAFAYQLMGGISYAVSPSWSLFGEARWFSTSGGEFFSQDGLKTSAGFDTVDFLMGASYGF